MEMDQEALKTDTDSPRSYGSIHKHRRKSTAEYLDEMTLFFQEREQMGGVVQRNPQVEPVQRGDAESFTSSPAATSPTPVNQSTSDIVFDGDLSSTPSRSLRQAKKDTREGERERDRPDGNMKDIREFDPRRRRVSSSRAFYGFGKSVNYAQNYSAPNLRVFVDEEEDLSKMVKGVHGSLTPTGMSSNSPSKSPLSQVISSFSTSTTIDNGREQAADRALNMGTKSEIVTSAVRSQSSRPSSKSVSDKTPSVNRRRSDPSKSLTSSSLRISTSTRPAQSTTQSDIQALLNTNFFKYALCLCVINFDLDIGQCLESIYPWMPFSEQENKTISFSSFPDSNSTSHLGDNIFSFRIRNPQWLNDLYRGTFPSTPKQSSAHSNSSAMKQTTMTPNDGYTYAYVFFRQQRDTEIRRGFFQKSLVLLTPHPWNGLWTQVVRVIGERYMNSVISEKKVGDGFDLSGGGSQRSVNDTRTNAGGGNVLVESCRWIGEWPRPPTVEFTSSTITLPVYNGRTFVVTFPPSNSFPQLLPITNSSSVPVSTFGDSMGLTPLQETELIPTNPAYLYSIFHSVVDQLWKFWELIIIGEPILVIGDTPTAVSNVIWACIELIKPLPYGGDFRPYFTIQDHDFKSLFLHRGRQQQALLLGVTNPLFNKLKDSWANVVRVCTNEIDVSGATGSAGASLNVSMSGGTRSTGQSKNSLASTLKGASNSSNSSLLSSVLTSRSVSTRLPHKPSASDSETAENVLLLRSSSSSRQKNPFVWLKSASTASTQANERPASPIRPNSPIAPISDGQGCGRDVTVDCISTKYKPVLYKDKSLIKSLAESSLRGSSSTSMNNTLRRHFAELTERFLQPLNRYFETLVVGNVTKMCLDLLRTKPEIRAFKQEAFLKMITENRPILPIPTRMGRDIIELYKQFLVSPNFASWLNHRTTELNREWKRKYLEILCEADVSVWVKGRQDVEIVDLLLRYKEVVEQIQPIYSGHTPVTPTSPDLSSVSSMSMRQTRTNTNSSICNSQLCDEVGLVVPSLEMYGQLKSQMKRLTESLPEELKGSFHC